MRTRPSAPQRGCELRRAGCLRRMERSPSVVEECSPPRSGATLTRIQAMREHPHARCRCAGPAPWRGPPVRPAETRQARGGVEMVQRTAGWRSRRRIRSPAARRSAESAQTKRMSGRGACFGDGVRLAGSGSAPIQVTGTPLPAARASPGAPPRGRCPPNPRSKRTRAGGDREHAPARRREPRAPDRAPHPDTQAIPDESRSADRSPPVVSDRTSDRPSARSACHHAVAGSRSTRVGRRSSAALAAPSEGPAAARSRYDHAHPPPRSGRGRTRGRPKNLTPSRCDESWRGCRAG